MWHQLMLGGPAWVKECMKHKKHKCWEHNVYGILSKMVWEKHLFNRLVLIMGKCEFLFILMNYFVLPNSGFPGLSI